MRSTSWRIILLSTLPCFAAPGGRIAPDLESNSAPIVATAVSGTAALPLEQTNGDVGSKPARLPAAIHDAGSRTVSPVSDTSVIWGSNMIRGSSVVRGRAVSGPEDRISVG
jgi:hypothetical protein